MCSNDNFQYAIMDEHTRILFDKMNWQRIEKM